MVNLERSEIKKIGKKFLKGVDLEFFKRVWSSDFNNYKSRLKALDINGFERVLDAGCGFGQWSLSMASLNKNIFSIDLSSNRINVLNEIINIHEISNIKTSVQSIQKSNFSDEYFDCIFCYSSIYLTDFKKTLKEFYRILKPGGKLYISTNGIGWYIHNLIDGHNSSKNFDSRKMAINAFENTLNYYEKGYHKNGDHLITPSKIFIQYLHDFGFKNILKAPDGKITINKSAKPLNFYPEKYYGKEGVYEILAFKDER